MYEWSVQEIEEKFKALDTQAESATFEECKPIELDKHLLYHASLCNMAVNNYNTAECVKLFQSLSHKSLKKLSISHCQDEHQFPKCLIAKNTDKTYFVAFESYLGYRFWDKISAVVPNCTFGKGL